MVCMKRALSWMALLLAFGAWSAGWGAAGTLDETPAVEGEWGYRPAAQSETAVTPPSFSWRPQAGLAYELQVCRGADTKTVEYEIKALAFNVHCPPRAFKPGTYTWRYRGVDKQGAPTNWSQPRTFVIPPTAVEMPMPTREDLIARIPKTHPRLFVRPEKMDDLRKLAQGDLKKLYDELVAQSEKLLQKPPSTQEPPKYPPTIQSKDEEWRKIWWGNREKTVAALNAAATLGFTYRLGGEKKYGDEARRILMECAKWDPKGATGYRYNDEAGMPYNYYFSRTYTFVNDILSEADKQACRQLMRTRGEEMYNHLYPRHLWQPYASHSNRAWHFLGEIAIAFMGEVPGAEDWLWFSMNVFFNCYPVWSDADGGWHEGSSYWSSYQGRFSWWADIMREAMGIDAYKKPYFSQVGYYPMYLMPPGKVGGGFGDLTAKMKSTNFTPLVTTFANQARNPYWQWWVDANGGSKPTGGYIGFIRGALPAVEAKEPADLPSSRLFRGIGQAYLNSNLLDAAKDVQIVFKSSPFGTQSHGYEANNSFLLWAYGERMLIRSGYRDIYGSEHHANWMWSTRSVNNITVNGQSQIRHSAKAKGEIVAFATTPAMDYVVGEAGPAYGVPTGKDAKGNPTGYNPLLDRYTRSILFVKPDLIVVYDRLKAKQPSTYEYWLHAIKEIQAPDQHNIVVRSGKVLCDIDIMAPEGITFKQTDQYDPNPRERVKLREWHLTGVTPGKREAVEFVGIYRPRKETDPAVKGAQLQPLEGGYLLRAKLADGEFIALLPADDTAKLSAAGLDTDGGRIVMKLERSGKAPETMTVK